MSRQLPLCKDCAFYNGLGRCDAPQNLLQNLVDGTKVRRWNTCEAMRDNGNGWLFSRQAKLCGREGRWFKLKEFK